MAKGKELLNRIKVIRSTAKITKAMGMVSIAKLEKTKRKLVALENYVSPLLEILPKIMPAKLPSQLQPYFAKGNDSSTLWVVVTSDRGLCGSFNNTILRGIDVLYDTVLRSGKCVEYMPIGNKALSFCKRKELPHRLSHVDLSQPNIWGEVSALFRDLASDFKKGKYGKIMLRYPSGRGNATVLEEQLFPQLPMASAQEQKEWLFEPTQSGIITELVPHLLATKLYRVLLRAQVGEYKARMLAMNQANENADSLLQKLNLIYNRLRQATITRGILEVTAGLNQDQ
jgi:F-type H+-transporting ATPase subunit gamma